MNVVMFLVGFESVIDKPDTKLDRLAHSRADICAIADSLPRLKLPADQHNVYFTNWPISYYSIPLKFKSPLILNFLQTNCFLIHSSTAN